MKILYFLAALSIALSIMLIIPSSPNTGHYRLDIVINGAVIPIPEIEGKWVSTHDGLVHFDRPGKLGDLFSAWGVVFDKDCLFQYCNENYNMYVNGIPNYEWDSYQVKNGDYIILEVWTF